MSTRHLVLLSAAGASLALAGCASRTGRGAVIGGTAGAVVGDVTGLGTAAGAVAGGTAGAVIGKESGPGR